MRDLNQEPSDLNNFVEFRDVVKIYQNSNIKVLDNISFTIRKGEFLILVGPSGCGKSTCLRLLAGLEKESSGEIIIDGKVVNELEPKERDISMVFQSYALFPHLTIYDNLAFGLRIKKVPTEEIDKKVKEIARLLNLETQLQKKPGQLSGGQRQRVALGRAIVRDAKVFLLDEPLSNLDAKLRGKMRAEIKRIQRSLNVTTMYVTHDQTEAMTMGDRIIILNNGKIQQIGTPDEIYNNPINIFSAGFIGTPTMNFFDMKLEKSQSGHRMRSDDLEYALPAELIPFITENIDVVLGIRPEDVIITEAGADSNGFEAVVELIEPIGPYFIVHLKKGATEIVSQCSIISAKTGETIRFKFRAEKVYVFDKLTGQSISYLQKTAQKGQGEGR